MGSFFKYRIVLASMYIALILLGGNNAKAQQIDIAFDGTLDCAASTLCVAIRLKAPNDPVNIGTSSIFIDYNDKALSFKSYTPSAFDGSDLCIANVATAWDQHSFDGASVPGDFNLTLTLLNNAFSCPTITSSMAEEVGILCFNILDNNLDPEISVNADNTLFNSAATNDGSNPVLNGILGTFGGATALACDSDPCSGQGGDTDNDGVCDTQDQCPNFDDKLIGTACDDGDVCTTGETYDSNCGCSGGVFQDADGDGICDAEDNNASVQPIDIDLKGALDCSANTFCVAVQLKTAGSAKIGTSSILLKYNATALSFKSYVSSTFDGSSMCIADVASAWYKQVSDGTSVAGDFNLTMTLLNNANSCPAITSAAVEVGTICFNILDNKLDPSVRIDATNTLFNSAATNDGSNPIPNGVLAAINGANALDCSDPCREKGGDSDNDGVCNTDDKCPSFDDKLIGTACDDGDPCTTGETYNSNCGCTGGVVQDADNDGVCDAQDKCPSFDDKLIGTACDDGNTCTTNDVYATNCNCVGTPVADADNDGVCDAQDKCPNFDDNLIGKACDDGDICTTGEIYDSNCGCSGGVFQDADGDGTCDAEDSDTAPQPIDIDLKGTLDCSANTFCVAIQLKTAGFDKIGTSSIFLKYNATALSYKSYVSSAFDGSDLCIANIATAWELHHFDGASIAGDFNLILTLLNNAFSCPAITSTAVEVGTVCFNVLDAKLNPSVSIDAENTLFNSAATNDGSNPISNGVLGTISEADALDCSNPCREKGGDSDADGVCNTEDRCPNLDDKLIGTACDDGDPCTVGEKYDNDCGCSGGVVQDTDNDGICDVEDRCPNDPKDDCPISAIASYCKAKGFSANHEYIDQVVLAEIDNSSGRDYGYGDYTAMIATLKKGESYSIDLTPAFGTNRAYMQHWKVWIDFNQDTDFDDAGEQILTEVSANAVSATITIPTNIVTNGTTIMRIAMQWEVDPASCGEIIFGEVEDYSVTIN